MDCYFYGGFVMKVKQLIQILKCVNPEFEVVMSKDPEGNYVSPFDDSCVGLYIPRNTWSGEFDLHSDEGCNIRLTEDECNAIFLWPIN